MAKNYTIKEAVEIIVEGKDLESITDLGRRYPVLTAKVAAIGAIAGDKFVDFMSYMPDYLTANKVNTAIKASIIESASGEDEAEENTEAESGGDDEEVDYNKFNGDTLIKMCKEKGIYERGMKKAALVKALEDYDANGGSNTTDEDESAGTETGNPYEGKSAMELFKECKARKIKAAPKKPAKFYADLLIKDDASKAKATEDEAEDDDDWGDEEAEAPKKEANASAKSGKAKAAKKAEAESEDDDDWDI